MPSRPVDARESISEQALMADLQTLRNELEDAQTRLAAASARASTDIADAFRRGNDTGAENARQEACAAGQDLMKRLCDELISTRQSLDKTLRDFETLAIDVAHATLSRMVGDNEHVQALVLALLREQLRQFASETMMRIVVSSRNFAQADELTVAADGLGLRHVQVVLEDALPDGGCLIEFVNANIDASWGTQVTRIFDALRTESHRQ
ncbi:FliH/SctL family protein [Burkholderia ubonensis]|uniref:FliH/SctL family protein n=1 Tax=Burkholderia ubonensis TaxID=101571 RepID=UPI001E3B5E35|nr:FliH/SctL family protein [Burkholderia ubonensis]